MGALNGYELKNVDTKNEGRAETLTVKSFFANIELKSHTVKGVTYDCERGYSVKYKDKLTGKDRLHPASDQCSEAKWSLHDHLKDQLGIDQFICDILWFSGLSPEELNKLRGGIRDNALPSSFSFKEFILSLLSQRDVKRISTKEYVLDFFYNAEREFLSIVNLFTQVRSAKGVLTRKKLELLGIDQLDKDISSTYNSIGQKFNILTGRAGTGKTVQLLQLAYRLAKDDNRCILLTYNHALVSDIRRLIDYAPLPTRVDGSMVAIKTINSFFHSLMKGLGIKTNDLIPTDKDYEGKYKARLKDLYQYVVLECKKEDIELLIEMSDVRIDWDYILVDEAQDFIDIEKKILFKIYGPNRICVADGVDQFMREGERQLWANGIKNDLVRKTKEMDLERRQKANLATFVNAYARLGQVDWSVRPNYEFPGGTVKIYKRYNSNIHIELGNNIEENECDKYDILILEPPCEKEVKDGEVYFRKYEAYKAAGITLFDGINPKNRDKYPTKDLSRVYLYQSCRGLEGWCVVCDEFDELINYQMAHVELNESQLQGLDEEETKWRNVLLWSLMPLTRPIDTLVITLKDPESRIGKIFKRLAESFPSFVEWNI